MQGLSDVDVCETVPAMDLPLHLHHLLTLWLTGLFPDESRLSDIGLYWP